MIRELAIEEKPLINTDTPSQSHLDITSSQQRFDFYYTLKTTNGTQGYYITPQAAKAMLTQTKWDSPVDVYMEWVAKHKVNNIIIKPFPIRENQESANTTILNDSGQYRGISNDNIAIPLCYKIFAPFYKHYHKLKRAVFKILYQPPTIGMK